MFYTYIASAVTHGQPVCVDHDTRCKQYQHQLCSTTVSQAYVIATCPLTCNKCTEYFGKYTFVQSKNILK